MIARVAHDRTLLSVRTIEESEFACVAEAFCQAAKSEERKGESDCLMQNVIVWNLRPCGSWKNLPDQGPDPVSIRTG